MMHHYLSIESLLKNADKSLLFIYLFIYWAKVVTSVTQINFENQSNFDSYHVILQQASKLDLRKKETFYKKWINITLNKNHEVCHHVLDLLKIFVHQLDNFDQNLNQSIHLIVKDLIRVLNFFLCFEIPKQRRRIFSGKQLSEKKTNNKNHNLNIIKFKFSKIISNKLNFFLVN
ncbi:hypothetical protein BpHYR1_042097 [Brachionus plicatilis]|uniref:Uncharacterized protein n=1 Tax=Brachionus plicatilis TaxID=10195 RepID=A0A3M7PZV7_BRAPC|nr:hypothetical protein BpHYR1_042097 [Brachionus plicatilis]